eukprot:TRINITY_DN11870_c0_g1_i5.p1 TRINITY_DN11870_c0_g1~~TRINITY_DN11870_c0_g1_i5.p1  ORF type:complete len:542 (+),score=78.55 TRINITY_DN11870_c0_g1_i5:139-1764(+)
MIIYDPGRCGILYAWTLKGSVFPRASVPGLLASLVAVTLHYVLRMNQDTLQQFGAGDASANVLGGFSFILGFLIVFRSQQAYSRWWEGGTLLQQLRGEWFNSFSCLIAFSNSASEKKQDVKEFQHQLVRLFSLLYGCALQQVASMDEKKFELIDCEGFDCKSLKYLQDSYDRCEITLQWIQRLIVESEQKCIVKIAPPILSRVFNELGNGIVNLNNARKITDFPIPFHLEAWAGIISFLVVFSYWAVYYMALEMEMPFGDDLNDLPLHEMQRDMNKSLMALLDKEAQEVPKFHYNGDQHDRLQTLLIDFDKTLCPGVLGMSMAKHLVRTSSQTRYSACDGMSGMKQTAKVEDAWVHDPRGAVQDGSLGPCPELRIEAEGDTGSGVSGQMDPDETLPFAVVKSPSPPSIGDSPPCPQPVHRGQDRGDVHRGQDRGGDMHRDQDRGRDMPRSQDRGSDMHRSQDRDKEVPMDRERLNQSWAAEQHRDVHASRINHPLPPAQGGGPDVAAGGAGAHPTGGARGSGTRGANVPSMPPGSHLSRPG